MINDRLIKALEDQCMLQEEILVKNEKIIELEKKISELQSTFNPKPKSSQKIRRRVSFSDLHLLPDYIREDNMYYIKGLKIERLQMNLFGHLEQVRLEL